MMLAALLLSPNHDRIPLILTVTVASPSYFYYLYRRRTPLFGMITLSSRQKDITTILVYCPSDTAPTFSDSQGTGIGLMGTQRSYGIIPSPNSLQHNLEIPAFTVTQRL